MKRVLLFLACALAASCGSTAQTRRTFPVVLAATTTNLVTDDGWTVTLTRADASLHAARFFSGKVLLARRWSPLDVLVGAAWAHPGHYDPGEAMAEVLAPVTANLLGAETDWGTASGVTGDYGSLQVDWAPAGLRLVGTATRGTQTVSFDTGPYAPPPVEGVSFEHLMDTKPGAVVITIDLKRVISRMEFDSVSGVLPPTSVAFNGFARGVKDTAAYLTTWK